MKKTFKLIVLASLLLCFTAISQSSIAQPHPAPPAEKGSSNNQLPSSAPIGNGTLVLLTLAMAYAGRKAYLERANPSGE
jgi:hypothetical protein